MAPKNEKPAGAGVTEAQVKQMIAEAIKGLVTPQELKKSLDALVKTLPQAVTKEQVEAMFSEALLKLCPEAGEAIALPTGEVGELFDESLLEGHEIDGRPLTTDDILSGTKSDAGVVTVVTRDGRKIEL